MRMILCLTLMVLGSTLIAQELTPKLAEKAKKNAALEIKNLPAKGWKVNGLSMSFEEMVTKAWEKRYSMANEKTPYYVAGYGNGNGKTVEEATENAIKKAKAQLPGLSIMYFSMWNTASDYSEKEKRKVDQAIAKAEDEITAALSKTEQAPDFSIVREKGGKYKVSVRFFWDQMKVRKQTREIIIQELAKLTDWDRDKMIKVLTYEQ